MSSRLAELLGRLLHGPRRADPLVAARAALPRGVAAGIAALFLALAADTSLEVARDMHRQSSLSHIEYQKRLLALVGEVELGNAVQDFKDCLLRGGPSYCDDFDRHIQVLEKTVSFYDTLEAPQAGERRALAELRQSLSAYHSAIYQVRDMQARRATIREIDAAVKGADRPIGAALRELAAFSASQKAPWHVRPGQAFYLAIYAALAALFIYLSLPALRAGRHARGSLPQLSGRIIDWAEHRNANAFVRLHDGVCQSLSAIMYFLKSVQPLSAGAVPEPVIPSLGAVIQDTRAVALQLRPPSLHPGGLLAALRSLWADYRARNPEFIVEARVQLEERDVPEGLKPFILRIAWMTEDLAEQVSSAGRLIWTLERSGGTLRLSIETGGTRPVIDESPSPRLPIVAPRASKALDAIEALAVLSGGSAERDFDGPPRQSAIECCWPIARA